jgi:hypothetical protein
LGTDWALGGALSRLLDDVADLAERVRSVKALRAREGRELGAETRARLVELAGELRALAYDEEGAELEAAWQALSRSSGTV